MNTSRFELLRNKIEELESELERERNELLRRMAGPSNFDNTGLINAPENAGTTSFRDAFVTQDEMRCTFAENNNTSTPNPNYAGRNEDTHDFFRAMEMLLTRFTETSRRNATNTQLFTYQFRGAVEEDPEQFINDIEDYLQRNSITSDREKISIVRGQLAGDARKWIDSFKCLNISWRLFVEQFFSQFDNPDCKVIANLSFFADRQGEKEKAAAFIIRKRQLMARLKPNISTDTAVGILITLLHPDIGNILRGARPRDMDELLRTATCIENGVRKSKGGATPHQNNAITYTENAGARMPPNPCRFCQQWHYNNECPQNPYKRNQGNWREAEEAAPQSSGNPRTSAGPSNTQRRNNHRGNAATPSADSGS